MKPLDATAFTKFSRPANVSPVGNSKTVAVPMALSCFKELIKIIKIGYTYNTDATASNAVKNQSTALLFIFITAAPPLNVLL
jgi:hypothetical protein